MLTTTITLAAIDVVQNWIVFLLLVLSPPWLPTGLASGDPARAGGEASPAGSRSRAGYHEPVAQSKPSRIQACMATPDATW
ncbi:MAG: hypothetical protein R2706_19075 [Acidimicrobiales bacterium]